MTKLQSIRGVLDAGLGIDLEGITVTTITNFGTNDRAIVLVCNDAEITISMGRARNLVDVLSAFVGEG